MDKDFWVSLAKNDYKIPEAHTLDELTGILFSYLGNTDSELRDDIAYIVYANFLKREMYSSEQIRAHVDELLANLEKGIGETESDSVFLRTFSVLLLAEIVYNDNKKPLLDKAQAGSILQKAVTYLGAEKDPRGFVPVKGWAHALAHTADLLQELGKSRLLEKTDIENIMQSITIKMVNSQNWVYIHGENQRLVNAVIAILQRDILSMDFYEGWLNSLIEPEQSWKGSYAEDGPSKAYHNTQNFIRSLFITIHSAEDIPNKKDIEAATLGALTNLKNY